MATSIEKWKSVIQNPQVVRFFDNLFDRVGVRIKDTGESFTCIHRGDRIDFEPTLDESRVDYVVEIQSSQVDRLAAEASKGGLDEAEQYRVMKELFTPATAATLRNPLLSGSLPRLFTGAEDVIHVTLKSPVAGEPDVTHTIRFNQGRWEVTPGLQGTAKRSYTLSLAEALQYQRHVFAALKADNLIQWLRFGLWYRSWRKAVSSKVG